MRKSALLVLASLLVLACDDQLGPPDLRPGSASPEIRDADHGGSNPFVRWLEPVAKDVQTANFGTFDPDVSSARLHVVCWSSNDDMVVDGGNGCSQKATDPDAHWRDPANAIDLYEISDGTLQVQDDQYHAQVELGHLSESDATTYTVYRLVVTVQPGAGFDPVVIAHADLRALENGKAKSSLSDDEIGLVGSKLPAKFRLDEGVVAHAIEDAINDDLTAVPEGLQAFGGGAFNVTVIAAGEETTATFEEDGRVTAAFLFGQNALQEGDLVAFAVGTPEDAAGDDVCGDAFTFERSGCKRAVAVSLINPQPPLSELTSGYDFQDDVAFCIATDIPESRQDLPWSLVKIDDYGNGPVYEVLPQQTGGICDALDDPEPTAPQLGANPAGWLHHRVARPILDFVVTPLYATHPADRMGSTLRDLSDLTAALLTTIEATDAPAGDIRAGAQVPVTFHVAYAAYAVTDDQQQEHEFHEGTDAANVPVSFSAAAGGVADPDDPNAIAAPDVTLMTDAEGMVTVLWTVGTGQVTLTAAAPGNIEPAGVTVTGVGVDVFGSVTDPAQDANGGPDLGTATAMVVGTDLTLNIGFHAGLDTETTRVTWSFDTDQDINTGFPGVNAGNGDSGLMGTDYLVTINGSAFGSTVSVVQYTDGTWTTTTTPVSRTVTSNGYAVVVPLGYLGWDDGFMNFKATTQTQLSSTSSTGIHDYVSDLGVAPGSTVIFEPVH